MFKKILVASVLSAAVLGSSVVLAAPAATANSQATAPTVAVINLPYILNEIPQTKAIQERILKEFAPREQELQKLQQQGIKISQDLQQGKFKGEQLTTKQRELAQIQADLQLKGRALQEDQQKRAQEEERKLQVTIQKAIDDIANARGIDLVLRGEGVVFTVPKLDLTEEIIKRVSADNGK